MNVVMSITAGVLNSLWQAAVLAAALWLALRLAGPRLNAATHHILWWVALAAVMLLPAIPRLSLRPSVEQPVAVRRTKALPVPAPTLLWSVSQQAPVTVVAKRPPLWPWILAGIWAVAFVYRATGILGSYLYLRALKQRATEWNRPLRVKTRRTRLLISDCISSPIAVGFWSPAVIVPEALREALSQTEMDCVLLHESAHLARYDDWTNLAARLLDALLVLHPVAWWLLRQIEREREIACDDWVVAATGAARGYAESLARIVELRVAPADSVLASGIFTRRSRLGERIARLLQRGRRFSTAAARIPIGAAALVLAVLAFAGAHLPHWIVFAQRLQFEVASVKINTDGGKSDSTPRRSGDLVTMHNAQIYVVLNYAYHINGAYQLVGFVPFRDNEANWVDIDARIGRDATDDEVRLMLQSLLADRFQLKVHRETREIPEYELTVAGGKPKVTPAVDGDMPVTIENRHWNQAKGQCANTLWNDGAHLVCHAVTTEDLVKPAVAELHAPVVDRTGLTGTYDIHIRYLSQYSKLPADADPVPTLEQAFQEELGLKLVKSKGPVEVLVIDHLEKPSAN